MKRLLDESPDELTRALLMAGIEDGPLPGNKARVIAALGAGGALGLFSSNAFAWFGTTAGKLTAAGVTVGVAGALFVAVPYATRSAGSVDAGGAGSRPAAGATAQLSAAPSFESPVAPGVGAPPEVAEAAASAPEAAEAGVAHVESQGSRATPAVKAATRRLASWRERRLLARKRAAAQAPSSEPAADIATNAAPAVSEPSGTPLASGTAEGTAPGSVDDRVAVAAPDLDSEVRLVDDMHRAARHNDREALGRFVERYREVFPHGQLEKEVAEFAARLEQNGSASTP